jgi:hypothetical protein
MAPVLHAECGHKKQKFGAPSQAPLCTGLLCLSVESRERGALPKLVIQEDTVMNNYRSHLETLRKQAAESALIVDQRADNRPAKARTAREAYTNT